MVASWSGCERSSGSTIQRISWASQADGSSECQLWEWRFLSFSSALKVVFFVYIIEVMVPNLYCLFASPCVVHFVMKAFIQINGNLNWLTDK